jgi:flagella basal body P-ring formation protein FlgA
MNRKTIALLAFALLAAQLGLASELQVRPRCQPRGPIVVVGDVAEMIAADAAQAEKLSHVELFPSPPPGQQRILRARELQDLLADRGIGLVEHRLSGSSQVVIAGFGEAAGTAELRPLGASAMKRAQRAVEDAIVKHLEAQASAEEAWQVSAELTDAQARIVPADAQKISVRGGQTPWTGAQNFGVVVDDAAHPAPFAVVASVSQLPRVVVAAKPIARGDTIRSTDLRLRRPEPGVPSVEAFRAVDDVVGMEAAQAIAAGVVLQKSLVRSPIMVRRGETIAVYSRAAGIRIRTAAKAREDAALGELVSVESVPDRKLYTARVCGVQEAEVYARAMQATPHALGGPDKTPTNLLAQGQSGVSSGRSREPIPVLSGARSDSTPRPVGNQSRSLGRSTK